MEYREIAPQPALRPYVRAIWTLCGKSDAPSFDLVLPDGFAEIVIHRTGRFREWRGPGDVRSQPLAVVAPVMDRAVALSPAASFETVGVRLWPCGLAHACEAPLRSFGDDLVSASDVLTRPATRLAASAAAADSLEDAVTVLQHGLFELFDGAHVATTAVRAAVRHIRRSGGARSVDDLARLSGATVRSLERHFEQWVGLSPKRYARVVRFQRAIGTLIATPDRPVAALAASYGYYDQAHLTRDVTAFTGWAPREFLRGRLGELTRCFTAVSDSSKTPPPEPCDREASGGRA